MPPRQVRTSICSRMGVWSTSAPGSADDDETALVAEAQRFHPVHVDPGTHVAARRVLEIPALEIAHRVGMPELAHQVARERVDTDVRLLGQVDEVDLVGTGRVPG